MRYTLLISELPDGEANDFEAAVQGWMETGWRPCGGVSVVKVGVYGDKSIYEGESIYRYHQAMTKDE